MLRAASTLGAALFLASLALLGERGRAEDEVPPRFTPWELDAPQPVDDGVPAEVEGWQQMSCARCHEEVAREWAGTRHALAWIDPHYQKAIKKLRRPQSCHGCHIPEAVHLHELKGEPPARERRHHLGVDCRACHDGPDGTILGPRGTDTDAHVSVRSESFTEEGASRLCITCHATHIGPVIGIARDFVASGQAERGRSCVACHMAPVERSMAHDPDEDGPAPVRLGRSHALQTPRDPAFLRRAFALSAERRGKGTAVLVANLAGHRVPGLEGREIEFRVVGLDAQSGQREERSFVISKQSHLPVDSTLEIELEMAADSVLVRGIHRAPGFRAPVEFLVTELRPAP